MAVLSEFIRNIAVYIIFAGLVGALVPNEKYRGYVDLLTGVILVILLISPLANVLRLNFDDILADFSVNFDRRVIAGEFVQNNDAQNTIILSAYRNNLREQLGRLVSLHEGYSFVDARFIVGESEQNFGEIKEVILVLSPDGEAERERSPFIRIEPISVRPGTEQRLQADEAASPVSDRIAKIKNAVSDFYNLPSSNIYITVQETNPQQGR